MCHVILFEAQKWAAASIRFDFEVKIFVGFNLCFMLYCIFAWEPPGLFDLSSCLHPEGVRFVTQWADKSHQSDQSYTWNRWLLGLIQGAGKEVDCQPHIQEEQYRFHPGCGRVGLFITLAGILAEGHWSLPIHTMCFVDALSPWKSCGAHCGGFLGTSNCKEIPG